MTENESGGTIRRFSAYRSQSLRVVSRVLSTHHTTERIPSIDDVLDDLGAVVLKAGGQVVIIPTERMPTVTGVAALYRY